MFGEQAINAMSKKDKERQELQSMVAEAIANGQPVTTIPAVEPANGDAEENDGAEVLTGKAIPLADVASYHKGNLTLDLNALKGHKVSDVTSISGYGDVLVTASLGKLKAQPKVDESIKDNQIQTLSAKAQSAYLAGEYAEAKELTARINALQNGQSGIKLTSNVSTTVVPLGLGTIEGNRFVFGRSAKGTVLFFDGTAYRLRFAVSRGLFKNESEQPTERQKARKAKKEQATVRRSMTREADIAAQKVSWMIEQAEASK
jgi:hypothetical protein